jgi:multidrug resistance efflux pump
MSLILKSYTVVSQVKHAYYGILQTESALESVEECIRLYKELDRVTADYVAQQTALKSQSLEIKTRLAKAEYDALTLRNPLATQKEQLNSLLGRDVRTLFGVRPVAESDWRAIDLEAARKAAIDRRPEVRQARLKALQAEQDKRVKKSEYIPDVSLTFNYFSPVNYGQLIPANIATVGVTVDWEPFDWGRKKHEMAQKDRTAGQASLAVGDAESQVLIDVGARFRKLEEARQLLIVGRLAQETAREKLRVMSNRYKEQASLLQDVLQAQARVTLVSTSSETRYSANITPDTQVAASFRVGGYVEKLLQVQAGDRSRDVGEGDVVARGTVLAQLRQSDFAIKVNQAAAQEAQTRDAWLAAKAQLAEAEASAGQARLDFGRASRPFSSQSATKADLDAAKARNDAAAKVDAARNQVQVVEAQRAAALESAKDAQLAQVDSALKAPLDGVILKKSIESGSLVGPGGVGFVLADTRYVKAVFGAPDTAVGELKLGQSLPVETEAVRRRAAVLVLRLAGIAAAQLRPDPHSGEGQARHEAPAWPPDRQAGGRARADPDLG